MSAPKESRRQARIQAVQLVYACEMRGVLAVVPGAEKDAPAGPEGAVAPFATELVAQTRARAGEIDGFLSAALENWSLNRLGAVDRAVLRTAVAEMLSHPDIPAAVTINEAIEIVRSLGSEESGRFINGVLDRVRKEIGRDPRATA
jgi:N utilization substance protein B